MHNILKKLPTAVTITGNWETRSVHVNGVPLRPERSQKLWNHSPDGFNWGYGGSGPAQLALGILLLFLDDETAVQYHQSFKFAWVAKLPEGNFGDVYDLRSIMKSILSDN